MSDEDHVEAALQRLRGEWRAHGLAVRIALRTAYWDNVRREHHERALQLDCQREAQYQRALQLDVQRDAERSKKESLAAKTTARPQVKPNPIRNKHHA